MKQYGTLSTFTRIGILTAAIALIPAISPAQTIEGLIAIVPVQMPVSWLVGIGITLLISIGLFILFQKRAKNANSQLKDVIAELAHTRERLTETNRSLEKSELDVKHVTNHYQNILFDAEVGTFQVDLAGKCTYINSAMQELSGLYPKKALKEGLQSAIHPDDRPAFAQNWEAFTEGNDPFVHHCRFKQAKGIEVHVVIQANRIRNERKDVESYIGWVSDVTGFHQETLQQKAETARYVHFVEETVEGYYQLIPETPIPLTSSDEKMAETIMAKMSLAACSGTFAAMYGSSPSELKGKSINSLQDGCGPFKNNETLQSFVAADYKQIDLESVRQDPRGNRLNLLNSVVGIIEDNKLVGIWGVQRNISFQKRELEELESQSQFMHRILNAIPADVYVKDTRCRYLYSSKKLSDRTGIPQEAWLGKTIFEVMPATPRDHDKTAIEAMKTSQLSRMVRPYEVRGKSGWMETVQIPLVSDDGLVEGVVGLSLDISERKKMEEEQKNARLQVEQQLKHRTGELQKTQSELGQTSIQLRETHQKLRIREAELENREHTFNQQLGEHKRNEATLRRNEDNLLTRQEQLEEQLAKRLDELDSETDKRKKWEELLSIKESELRKIEVCVSDRNSQLTKEIAQRKQMEADLSHHNTELEKALKQLDTLSRERDQVVATLTQQHKQEVHSETTARSNAENKLKRTEDLLEKTQARIKALTEQHAEELEHEVDERKNATSKLIQNAEELDELKQQFNMRLEKESAMLKQELAQKQIREKALRQHEKDLEVRIKELEQSLQLKIREHNEQIQAREGAEVQRSQIEQKLQQVNTRQEQLIERETQKLNLNIAEIRLDEIKLRKQVGDLQQAKEDLESIVELRTAELSNAAKEQQKTASALSSTQSKLDALAKNQTAFIAKETGALQSELEQAKQSESHLRAEEDSLKKYAAELKETIRQQNEKLTAEIRQRELIEKELQELQMAFDASQDNVGALLEQHTDELQKQVAAYKQNELSMQKAEAELKKQAEQLQHTIEVRTDELEQSRKERENIENDLADAIKRSSQGAKEIEAQIAQIKSEHAAHIQELKDEGIELKNSEKHFRTLFQASSDAFLQLNPKTGKIQTANMAASELFGVDSSGGELSGKTLDSFSPSHQPDNTASADLSKARLHSAIETGHNSFEWVFEKADGSTLHTLVSLSTIDVQEHQHILAIINDISEIKRQMAELQERLDVAHAANRMSSHLVDEVNESIKTSLIPVVKTSSSIEKDENLTVEQRLEMAVIKRNCRGLIDAMNYRKELSHIADGTDEFLPAKCDLHELIKNLDHQFGQRAETKKLFFAVSYAQYQSSNNVPKLVETDEHKVRKVLSTLLGYALEHTEKGRLGLHAARKSSDEENMTIAFELAYTGLSEQDALLNGIFGTDECDDEMDLKYGLTLAKRYVHMLKGTIDLEYRKGGITSLTISFPFKKVAAELHMPNPEAEKKAGAA